jgi:hypothetical protein
MPVYHVSYDLGQPGQRYADLINELAKFGGRILLSDWIIEVDQTARQVVDAIRTYFLDTNDRVVVIEITTNADWSSFRPRAPGGAFLKRRRP